MKSFFSRKTCLTDFRNVWSESTSVIGITCPCVQTVAPNAGLCTLSSVQVRGEHCSESSVGRPGVLTGAMRGCLLTNTCASLCFLYIAAMEHHSQKQLRKEEFIYFSLLLSDHTSLWRERKPRWELKAGTWTQELKQRPRSNVRYQLTSQGLLSLLS